MKESAKKILSDARRGKHFSPSTEFKDGYVPPTKGKRKFTIRTDKGYIRELSPSHPRADCNGYVFQHILVAERCLGRFLVDLEVIHHIDESKDNNEPSNLYIFENNWEHLAFHAKKKKYGLILKSNLFSQT